MDKCPPAIHRRCIDSVSSGKSTERKVTIIEPSPSPSESSSEDGREIAIKSWDNVPFAQAHPQAVASPILFGETSHTVLECDEDDFEYVPDASSLRSDAPSSEISKQFPISFPTSANLHRPQRSSYDSDEEASSDLSVEEKRPLSAQLVTSLSISLHKSSTWTLRSYKYLKHIVRQRLYRRYYVKWLQSVLQRVRSATKQTLDNRMMSSSTVAESLFHSGDIICGSPADAPLTPLLSSGSEYGNRPKACYDESTTYRESSMRFVYKLAPDSTEDKVAMHPGNGWKTTSSTTPHLPQTLLSRSRHSRLQDYGRLSSPVRRVGKQDSVFPNIVLPHLLNLGCHITFSPSQPID